MNGTQIAARVAAGYAKAGAKLGLPHTLYRPIGPLVAALDGGSRLRSLSFIASATPETDFRRPSKYGEPLRYGLFDTRLTQAGDYIDGPTGTYFIASQATDEGPMVVQCNAVLSVTRSQRSTGPGIQPYGGSTVATNTPIITTWPASLLLSGRTTASHADLPGDVPLKGAQALFPAFAGTLVRTSDRITDDMGRAFTVSGAERSDLGWRIELITSVT